MDVMTYRNFSKTQKYNNVKHPVTQLRSETYVIAN